MRGPHRQHKHLHGLTIGQEERDCWHRPGQVPVTCSHAVVHRRMANLVPKGCDGSPTRRDRERWQW